MRLQLMLYPKFSSDETAERHAMTPPKTISEDCQFDDKTYFQLKVRPEYLLLRCSKHEVPITPITFSCNSKELKTGAPEEYALCYPGDEHVSVKEVLEANTVELPPAVETIVKNDTMDEESANLGEMMEPASWLSDEPLWNSNETNYFRTRPDFRTYNSLPLRTEIDPDYSIRPYARPMLYDQDQSLRSEYVYIYMCIFT